MNAQNPEPRGSSSSARNPEPPSSSPSEGNRSAEGEGEVKAEASISYEKEKTAEDVVAEADTIFVEYKAKMKAFRQEHHLPRSFRAPLNGEQQALLFKEQDRLFDVMYRKHREFAQYYNVALRFMVQAGEYNSQAFRQFLNYFATHSRTDDEQYESWGQYRRWLHRAYHPRATQDELNGVYKQTIALLKNERKKFEERAKKAMKEIEEKNQHANERKRAIIAARMKQLADESMDQAESVKDLLNEAAATAEDIPPLERA